MCCTHLALSANHGARSLPGPVARGLDIHQRSPVGAAGRRGPADFPTYARPVPARSHLRGSPGSISVTACAALAGIKPGFRKPVTTSSFTFVDADQVPGMLAPWCLDRVKAVSDAPARLPHCRPLRLPARDFCSGCSETGTSSHGLASCGRRGSGRSWEQLSQPAGAWLLHVTNAADCEVALVTRAGAG